jgi:hypothetical protein
MFLKSRERKRERERETPPRLPLSNGHVGVCHVYMNKVDSKILVPVPEQGVGR